MSKCTAWKRETLCFRKVPTIDNEHNVLQYLVRIVFRNAKYKLVGKMLKSSVILAKGWTVASSTLDGRRDEQDFSELNVRKDSGRMRNGEFDEE